MATFFHSFSFLYLKDVRVAKSTSKRRQRNLNRVVCRLIPSSFSSRNWAILHLAAYRAAKPATESPSANSPPTSLLLVCNTPRCQIAALLGVGDPPSRFCIIQAVPVRTASTIPPLHAVSPVLVVIMTILCRCTFRAFPGPPRLLCNNIQLVYAKYMRVL